MANKPNRPIKMTLPDKNTRRLVSVAKNGSNPQNQPLSAPQKRAYASSSLVTMPISRTAQAMGGGNTLFTQPMFFSPLHTPQNWQIASKRQEVYQWARFYYENEPKVAAGIDFYAQFPINGYKLECKSKKIQKFFERLCDELEILRMLRLISHERFLLGDVFVFLDIDSPDTRGETELTEADWTHADGTISRIIILNPDWIEVYNTPLADEPEIVLLPDDELKKIVQMKSPRSIYDRLPENIKSQVLSARPIRLSNRVTSHIKHGGAPYGTYGDSLLRRLFTMLAYKTKLMTANWIVAERLVLPVRVVKIGDKDRPASEDDIADVQAQLGAIANDPNLTIVTHHAFDYEWYGASGKIHNITNELEAIGKELLDGMMINQALLNGEMAAYSSAQVGVELLIRRLESWRNELADWVEKNIFLIVAKMQGFVDEDASKEAGETVYITPSIKWDDLRLRDPTNKIQQAIQLNQNGIISNQTLLEMMDLDYDQEIHKIREEQVMVGPQGGMMPGGDPMGGMGGMGGGMPGGDPMGGGMGGGMPGGMPGGDMSGGMGGGMGGGMPGAAAGSAPPQKISKRGKGQKEEEVQPVMSQQMQLTKPEAKTLSILEDIGANQQIYVQYKVQVPGQPQPYALDFAYPQIGLNIEADGEKWHTSQEDKTSDQERDVKLAQQGWTVVRVSESALNENANGVKDLLTQAIVEATELRRKMSKKGSNNKVSFVQSSAQSTDSPHVLTHSKPEIIEDSNA